MELKTYFAQDAAGNIISSAIVNVFLQGTTTLATGLTRADGTPLENPFAADGAGRIQFRAPDGYYDVQVSAGPGIIQTLTIQCVDYSGAKADADRAEVAADRADTSAEQAQNALNSITGINSNFEQNSREQWRRSLAEAGLTLVSGSFEEGATVNSSTDAVWHIAGGQCYTWTGGFPYTAEGAPGEGWVEVEVGGGLRQDDIRRYGAIGYVGVANNLMPDAYQAIMDSLDDNGSAYIPKGLTFNISKTIKLHSNRLDVDGVLNVTQDVYGVWLQKGAIVNPGDGDRHITHAVKGYSKALVLLYNNDSEGCVENFIGPKVFNIVNGFIDFTSAQGDLAVEDCTGTGVFMLAGDRYGLATKYANEHVYRNNINVRVDGFARGISLEADLLTIDGRTKNGWVNGNHINASVRRSKRYLELMCPLGGLDGLDGECSGNTGNFDFQYSSDLFEVGAEIQGNANKFNIQMWDAPEDSYPIIKFTKKVPSNGYGITTPSYNIIELTGARLYGKLSKAVYEQDIGFNTIISGHDTFEKQRFPINSQHPAGQREHYSYTGAISNVFGLRNNVRDVSFTNASLLSASDRDMFTPDRFSYTEIGITGGNPVITVDTTTTVHISTAGITLYGVTGNTVNSVLIEYLDGSGSLKYSQVCTGSHVFMAGKSNVSNVRTVRYTFNVANPTTGTIRVANLFADAHNRRTDYYHLRLDDNNTVEGDNTFLGLVRIKTNTGLVLTGENGRSYTVSVDTTGALKATILPQ